MTIVLCWNKKNKVNHVKILKKYSKGDQYQKKLLISFKELIFKKHTAAFQSDGKGRSGLKPCQ